ncbi:grifin [Protopterus annectens]|uniref:grifin n=1 Tax=Protopterus annectens TaxID=7888 RepID=UPI001CF9360D|nr:grifin [Protopterus annectens]
MALRFEASCPEGFCPGWSITVKGQPAVSAKSFEINFLCDMDDRIAFHFNPRFSDLDIICNTFKSNRWGKEERSNTFHFDAEEPFQVEIFSDRSHFHVFVDENKVVQYQHRIEDLQAITRVQIVNDISITSVEIAKKPDY